MSGFWHAGVSVIDITPPPGLDLAGFAIREQGAIGTLDPLHVKTLVLEDGTQRAALLTVDLLGIAATDVVHIRKAAERRTGIPAGNIMIAASHTHSAPATLPTNGIGNVDPEWLDILKEKLIHSVAQASKRLVPVSIYFSRGSVDIGVNRRGKIPEGSIHPSPDPSGVNDRELSVLQFVAAQTDTLFAVFFNCACHPVVLGANNRYFSSDFPGAAMRFVEQAAGENTVVMFTNGGCGNINPIEMGTYEIAEKLGERLGKQVLKALSRKEQPLPPQLKVDRIIASLPFADLPTEKRARRQVERYEREYANATDNGAKVLARACLNWAKKRQRLLQENRLPARLDIEIQCIFIGNIALIAIPGEVFAETALFIKKKAPDPVIVAGYGNGNVGYLPPEAEIAKGGYEVLEAHKYYDYPNHFAAQAENNIRQAALKLLRLTM